MKIRKIMWFSLFVQIATLIIMLSLLFMKIMIPDLLWGIFVTSMFVCIVLSFFVQRANVKEGKTIENQHSSFKMALLYIPLIVSLIALLFITFFYSC